MIGRLFKKAIDFLRDPSRSFRARVFILLTLASDLVALIALVFDIVLGENSVEIVALIVTVILVPTITLFAVKRKKENVASQIIVLGLVFALIPILFFYGGGIRGGGIPWIIFAYLYIGLVSGGVWKPIMLVILTAETIGFYIHGFFHPGMVAEHSEKMFYYDSLVSVILVGIICCMVVWFEERLFAAENKRAKDETLKLEDMNRSQSRFFSSMSHEIRTPINSILGLNEIILRQEDASDEVIRDANNIQGAGRMLLALINDILDFSKIEAGKMEIVPVNYNIASMVSEIVNMLWLRTEQKGLEFKVEVDPSIPSELFGDEVRIKQILVNLLNNSVKYTQEGSITLHIEREDLKEDQVLLSFSVIDTGMGIKQDAIPYLFDAFKRVDEEKNTRIEGTGLGLSIVKQLVDLMDGRITVNSVYTQGSTFMVTLWQKVTRFDAVGSINLSNIGNPGRGGRYSAGFTAPDVRILIVDDNDMNLEVEKKLLSGTRITVDTAMSGETALSMTSSARYDLILMDHLMPEMDGIECMQHIRKQADGLNNHAPIIVLTANAASENRELYNSSGFDGYLVKPVSGRQLEETILSHLPESKVIISEGADSSVLRNRTLGSYSRKIPVLIATNSTCDLPRDVIKEFQIDTIPYSISTGGRTYYDDKEAGTDELLRYKKAGVMFEAEPPTVVEFEKFFGQELKKAHNIIYISVSSGLNSEYERARTAARAYGNVRVFDTELGSAGIGLLVLIAYRMSTQGKSPDKIIEELSEIKNRIRCTFLSEGTYFTQRRDFMDKSIYNFMNILNIRPVIKLKGKRFRIERIFFGERDRCFAKYIDHVLMKLPRPDPELLMLVYVDLSEDELVALEEHIRKRINFKNIIFQRASSVLALSCGSDSFGLIYMTRGVQEYNLNSMLAESGETDYPEAEETYEGVDTYAEDTAAEDATESIDEEPESLSGTAWYDNIEGIDGAVALRNSGSEDAFKTVLKIFYDSIDVKSAELEGFYQSENWADYTIKIHALKSSARLVGAVGLGTDAESLEMAGKEGRTDFIKANHGAVMEEFRAYHEYLAPVFSEGVKDMPDPDEDSEPDGTAEKEEVNELFDKYLIESVYEVVRDGAVSKDDRMIADALAEIKDYKLPAKDRERMDRLKELSEVRDYDGMLALIDG